MVSSCKATTHAGLPCSARPVRADGYCYWHSPATADERAEGRRLGGRARSNQARAKKQLPADPMSDQELLAWLGVVFKRVVASAMQPGVATAAASVAKAMVAVRQSSEIEQRLTELEQRIDTTNDRRRFG